MADLKKLDMTGYVGYTLLSIEKELILSTLVACAGNRTWACEILGISLLELREKLNSYSQRNESQDEESMLMRLREYDHGDSLPS